MRDDRSIHSPDLCATVAGCAWFPSLFCTWSVIFRTLCACGGLPLVFDEPLSQHTPGKIDDGHEEERENQQRKGLAIFEKSQRGDQLEANPAGADKAHDCGSAQIMLPAVERKIDYPRQNLRQHAETERLPA